VIEVYDDPPPVRVRVRDWPRRKRVDDDKPKRPEYRPERPSRQVDKVTKPPKPLRTYPTRTVTPNTTVVPRNTSTSGMVPRPMINRGPMFSRPMPMGPRFGGGMMGRFR